ncbi:Vta1 like-domain-containing protein [Biscogniauxia mediterranea]|nr:Vta1 like-domain-containing protein [Biscogniauxia mediterranea]
MAANIPAKIKQAGLTPFVVRAAQLESAKPVIAYWCQYWVVNQILAKQLHTVDQECLQFTTNMMDKLEQTKTDNANNDAILDDAAGQAYVEQFAQETFERALRPLKANKVTQQTASTFEAAATFFQLTNIWGQPDAETLGKIKYSKWNAARILKAIKEGKDPNESNPKQEEERAEESAPALDPNDPEVQMIHSAQPRPVTVEDVPDEGGKEQPTASGYSLQSPARVSAPTSPLLPSAPAPEQVSPIAPPDPPVQDLGDFFPSAPAPPAESTLDLPSTTSMPAPGSQPFGGAPSAPPAIPSPSSHEPGAPPSLPSAPQDFYRTTPQPPTYTPTPHSIPPQQQRELPAAQNYSSHPPQPTAPSAAPRPTQQYGSSGGPTSSSSYNTDDMAIVQAQKHAKWAISALNFEDVPTAVRELQAALATLGAR